MQRLGAEESDDQLKIIVRSRFKDLDEEITKLLERNAALKAKLLQYQRYETWNGSGICPVCRHNNLTNNDGEKANRKEETSVEASRENQNNLGAQFERSKLKFRESQKRKRHHYTNHNSSPEEVKPSGRRQWNIFDSDEEQSRPTGRVLVPETCPNDSIDLTPNTNLFVPGTEAQSDKPEGVPEKIRKLTNTCADTEVVHHHGLTSQIDSMHPDSRDDPEITSTPVCEVTRESKSGKEVTAPSLKLRSPVWGSDSDSDTNEASQQVIQIQRSERDKSSVVEVFRNENQKSYCLFNNSEKDDGNSLVNEKVKAKVDDIGLDDDDWLLAVKEEGMKKRSCVGDTGNAFAASGPSQVQVGKAYRQQTIIGMLKKPKVDISNLDAFDGGALNQRPFSPPKRSPLKIRLDVDHSPLYSDDKKPITDSSSNDADTRSDIVNVKPKPTRPPLVRQDAVDYDDDLMQNSVKFGPGLRHAASSVKRGETWKNDNKENVNDASHEIGANDEVMNELDLDSDEEKHVFRKPKVPEPDMDETFDCSFDRVPSKKTEDVGYVYHHTDRRKVVRQKMEAFDCAQCEAFYAGLPEEERHRRVAGCSRHRALHAPPSTPPGFWEVGFPPTPEEKPLEARELREEERARARRKRRYEMRDPNRERADKKSAASS